MKLIDIKAIEMDLPKGWAAELKCADYSILLTEHVKENKKLKFIIKIYEVGSKEEEKHG